MKRIALLLMATLLIFGFSGYSQNLAPGAVVGISKVTTLNDDITNNQLETYYQDKFIPAFNKEAPTVPICLMRKIAGKRMGEYAEFYAFESLVARDEWFPKPGVSSEKTKELFKSLGETWDGLWKVISSVSYTDYLVLPFKGNSIDVKPGNVVIVFECEITPEEGMTFKDLEKFYQQEYGPAYTKYFQGTQFCVLKGDRGERTGKYAEVMVCKSMDDYRQWVTAEGKLSEKARKAYSDMGKTQEKMEKMYTWSRFNTYIVL
jgi:hypothetical protein